MPKMTVYIRKDDIDEWRKLSAKSTFVHNALNIVREGGEEALGLIVDDRTQVTNLDKPLVKVNLKGEPLCKVHGTPLDTRGRCLQKGCKYA